MYVRIIKINCGGNTEKAIADVFKCPNRIFFIAFVFGSKYSITQDIAMDNDVQETCSAQAAINWTQFWSTETKSK